MSNTQYLQKIKALNQWAHARYAPDHPVATDEEYDGEIKLNISVENESVWLNCEIIMEDCND